MTDIKYQYKVQTPQDNCSKKRSEIVLNAIANDPYLKKRKAPTEAEQQLYLKEVSFKCPLCGKDLRNRKQKKNNKLYEIAHIFPNGPTVEQYILLGLLERLGEDSESFENKIALCKDCHEQQDYHTTQEDYLTLLRKKREFLRLTALHEATLTLGLEQEIAEVVSKIRFLGEDEWEKLNYSPVKLSNKFYTNELLLKTRVSTYVTTYYPYIRECFRDMEGVNGFCFETLCLQIKGCFVKMEAISDDKEAIFEQMANWIAGKTCSTYKSACEAVVSFFVQQCEVFHEITE